MTSFDDRVLETTTSSGTGNLTLAGAVTGYQSFNSAFGLNAMFWATIVAVDGSGVPTGDWETGRYYLSGTTTLVRAFVDRSSNSDALVSFAVGTTKQVFSPLTGHGAQAMMIPFNLQFGMP